MAAPNTPISGVTMLLKSPAGTAVAAQEDVTLNIEQDLPSVFSTASARWDKYLKGPVGWSVDFANLYWETGAEVHGCGSSLSFGGVDLSGVKTLTVNMEHDLQESTSQTTSCVKAYVYGTRRVSVDFEAVYYDPNAALGASLDTVLLEVNGTTTSGIAATTVQFGSTTITGTTRPTNVSVTFPSQDVALVSGTLNFTGAVVGTYTGNNTGQKQFLDNFFSDTAVFTVQLIDASSTASQTTWTGSGYVESIGIEIPYDDAVRISGTMRGSGALTKSNP